MQREQAVASSDLHNEVGFAVIKATGITTAIFGQRATSRDRRAGRDCRIIGRVWPGHLS